MFLEQGFQVFQQIGRTWRKLLRLGVTAMLGLWPAFTGVSTLFQLFIVIGSGYG